MQRQPPYGSTNTNLFLCIESSLACVVWTRRGKPAHSVWADHMRCTTRCCSLTLVSHTSYHLSGASFCRPPLIFVCQRYPASQHHATARSTRPIGHPRGCMRARAHVRVCAPAHTVLAHTHTVHPGDGDHARLPPLHLFSTHIIMAVGMHGMGTSMSEDKCHPITSQRTTRAHASEPKGTLTKPPWAPTAPAPAASTPPARGMGELKSCPPSRALRRPRRPRWQWPTPRST